MSNKHIIYFDEIDDVCIMLTDYRNNPKGLSEQNKLIENRRTIFKVVKYCDSKLGDQITIQIRRLIYHRRFYEQLHFLLSESTPVTQFESGVYFIPQIEPVVKQIKGAAYGAGYNLTLKKHPHQQATVILRDRYTKRLIPSFDVYLQGLFLEDVVNQAIRLMIRYRISFPDKPQKC